MFQGLKVKSGEEAGMNQKGKTEEPGKDGIIGYYTEDENIYCTECIRKNIEVMKRVAQVILAEGPEEGIYYCDGCGKEVRRQKNFALKRS